MASVDNLLKAPSLITSDTFNHAFFTRENGVSKGIFEGRNIGLGSNDDRDLVLKNRAMCMDELGANIDKLATPYQIHSAEIVTVNEAWEVGKGPKADGLVTNRPGIALGIATADCGPVLFADDEAGVIGAAHAGWRGATSGVLENTIQAMEELGAERDNIVACLGPTIAQQSYEVGPEFIERLLKVKAENRKYFIPSSRKDHAMFDLQAYIVDRLNAANIKQAEGLNLDTYEDEDRFYSFRRTTHRKEADYGRLLSAIVLR